ncbi:MAG TPA: efflux RND transporter periplasmic adaptor subunit [Chitinispirillaceae bacterium]|nr:efflux RND transporter periplasmic adaptor subunit [Chitinispirillaceae bacterium]
MNRKVILSLLIIAIIAASALIPRFLPKKTETTQQSVPGGDKAKSKNGGRAVTVSVQTAAKSLIAESFIITGTIRASNDIEIRNEIAGRVIGLYFKEGTSVKKNQLLVALNDRELQAQYLKASAVLKLVKDKELRQKGLFDKQIISVEEYLTSVKDLESAEADVLLLKAQLEKTKIYAPFSGTIGLSTVSIGEYLTAGTVIASLVSIDNPSIEFAVPERYASSLGKGMKVTFTLSESAEVFNAEVMAIEPRVDETTRSISIKARCLEKDSRLLSGAFVKVTVTLNPHDGYLVPGDAVISDIQGYKLYLNKDGKAVPVLVKTGFRDEKNVEIVSGLSEGDVFITTGAFLLRPNARIEIADNTESGAVTNKEAVTADNKNGSKEGKRRGDSSK